MNVNFNSYLEQIEIILTNFLVYSVSTDVKLVANDSDTMFCEIVFIIRIPFRSYELIPIKMKYVFPTQLPF